MERDQIYSKFIPLVQLILFQLPKFPTMQTRSGATSPVLNTDLLRDFFNSPDGLAILQTNRPAPLNDIPYTLKQIALYQYMTTCVGSTKPQDYWASKYPTDESIDLWYIQSGGLLDAHPPGDIFAHLSFVPPINPNDDHQANDIFQQFKLAFPWSIHLKGFQDTDIGYLQTLTIYNGSHPIPLPTIDTNIKDPVYFATWLYNVEKYYAL